MVTFRIKSAAAYLAAAALFATAPALAQRASIDMADAAAPAPAATAAPAAGGAELQEVTVSASAITISGYDQPTPVTSLGIQQLQVDGPAGPQRCAAITTGVRGLLIAAELQSVEQHQQRSGRIGPAGPAGTSVSIERWC